MLKRKLLYLFVFVMFASCSSDNNSTDNPPNIDDTPVAVDDTLTVEEDSVSGTANQVTVSANDDLGDDGGDDDNYALVSAPTEGTVTEVSDGVFEYIPNADFLGADSFTYTLTDADGDTDTATVTINVNERELTAEDFSNINPDFPSFVSIDDTTPNDKKWVKLESMSDEFDAWDSNKWFKSTWNYGFPVNVVNSNENSGVADGKLWIKATLSESDPDGRWFHTSRIHSKAESSYPMYAEASIKTAHISAYNTFWMNKGTAGGTYRDEIDIIENNSNPSCTNCQADLYPQQMNSQYFHADADLEPNEIRNKDNFLRSDLSVANPLRNVGWNEDYHTYGVWWKDERNIQFYLDGEPAGSVVVGEHNDGTSHPDRFFTRELEIIFDLWTNEAGWLGGLPPKSDLGDDSINTMRVDWVRTWKLEDE
ncbi:Ig-like domain-containing protein [uncultured Algibacter sp.]|uniref:Ig-like domain-containing protein n=1 Tax=uncultured Algibacter sp. TaxID=298659 RepID=UPI00262764FD|nr:Ig-like domain-containing protein [uncultured Algibacter sp.]